MRKWLSAICIILMLLPLIACDASEKQYIESELNPDTGVSMKTVYPVYDKSCEQISFIIENNSEERIEFGSDWQLERLSGKRWKSVNWEIPTAFTDILYFSEPGAKRYFQCSMKPFQKGLKDGRYRFIKEIEGAWYTAEFEIGDSPITAQTPHGFVALQDLPDEYTPEQAAADGVVILREDGIVNSEAMSAFFTAWTQRGFCGQLRVMSKAEDGWILTDLILGDTRGTDFRITLRTDDRRKESLGAVQTSYYSFFHVEDNRLWLSNYRDFESRDEALPQYSNQPSEQIVEPFVYHRGSVPLFSSIRLPQQITELIDDTRDRETTPGMIVWSPDGKIRASIGNNGSLALNTAGWGTMWSGTWGDREVLDLTWKYDDTLNVVVDWSSNLFPTARLYESIYIDAEDMKSIRTLSSNTVHHDFSIRGSLILE